MAAVVATPALRETAHPNSTVSPPGSRPFPTRTYSESQAVGPSIESNDNPQHVRRKSAHTNLGTRSANPRRTNRPRRTALAAVQEREDDPGLPTPPSTPAEVSSAHSEAPGAYSSGALYDFSQIDYEIERARTLGRGLWSSVYLAQPQLVVKPPQQLSANASTSPITPERKSAILPCSLFAVKVPSRADAKEVFLHEAKILTALQASVDAQRYIVPFYGLDVRSSSLVFEGVVGGSLENLIGRLKMMTELARHLELRNLFPHLVSDLVAGLQFIHAAGVVHADIKPANVLLDISDQDGLQQPVIRARYIDFSAAFLAEGDSVAYAGGTWDFMAPEQLRTQQSLNTPTFASDIWSLGITLLSIIAGGSPYAAACGNNLFMLREAIKGGDPLGFARMDPNIQKRMSACQDFIDCCRLALQRDRTRRTTAVSWRRWLVFQQFVA